MVYLFYTTYISVDLAHHEILHAKFGEGGISIFKLNYSKTCLKWPLNNRQNTDLNDKCYLNEGRKYCRMLHLEHSVILLTCIK